MAEQATTTADPEAAAAVDEALRAGTRGAELVVSDVDAGEGFRRAEQVFTEADRAAIASFLNVEEGDPALIALLAVAAQLGLNPLLGEVWLIPVRMKIRDAEGKKVWADRYRVAVGRDGLLKNARRSKGKRGGYRGLQYDVVCERDSFEVAYTGDFEHDPKVLHRYATKPMAFGEGEDAQRYRGRIIGAWAKLTIDGEPPHFYFANLREHGRTRVDSETGARGWDGAWGYTSGMVLKSAQSYVLRIGLGVTGIVPVDELRDPGELREDRAAAPAAGEESFDWDDAIADEDLRGRLFRAVATANEQEAGSWLPAKCEMVLSGRTDAELRALAEQIEAENEARERRMAASAGEVVDAETVDGEAVEEQQQPEPGQQPEPEERDEGRASDEGYQQKIEALRALERDLEQRRGLAQSDRQEEELNAELDRVQDALRGLLGDSPDQSSPRS